MNPKRDARPEQNTVFTPSTEDIQETYREMYNNWPKVCNANKSLKGKNYMIDEENVDLKSALVNLKNLVKEKDKKI